MTGGSDVPAGSAKRSRPLPRVELLIEGVDPGLIGVVDDPPSVPPLLAWCWALLDDSVPHPERLQFVMTGRVADSVAQRVPAETDGVHAVEHGGGMSAGKTLRLPKGRAVVLLHAHCFRNDLDQDQAEANLLIVRRVMVHELQHVIMHQTGQVHEPGPDVSFRDLNLMGGVAAIIEEYRAEISVGEEYRRGEPVWQPAEIIADLTSNLDVAIATYQGHRSTNRMVFEVVTAVLVSWRGLAYAAARAAVIPDGDLFRDVHESPTWAHAFDEQWKAAAAVLRQLQPGDAVMSIHELDQAAHELAKIISYSMAELGFPWEDGLFMIERSFIETPTFNAALRTARAREMTALQRLRTRWGRSLLGGPIAW
jgi:hypothetical protein